LCIFSTMCSAQLETRLQAGRQVWFLAGAMMGFFSYHCIQTVSGACPASCLPG
jgi:hypothetical protein